ncbi:MAG: aromatic amino acid lyase, partial [Acidimicrobiia bacterium]
MVVNLSGAGVTRRDVLAVARAAEPVALDPAAKERIARGAAVVADLVGSGRPVYGLTTGFGALATTRIPVERTAELQLALLRSHAAGMGPPVEREVVRAMPSCGP